MVKPLNFRNMTWPEPVSFPNSTIIESCIICNFFFLFTVIKCQAPASKARTLGDSRQEHKRSTPDQGHCCWSSGRGRGEECKYTSKSKPCVVDVVFVVAVVVDIVSPWRITALKHDWVHIYQSMYTSQNYYSLILLVFFFFTLNCHIMHNSGF